MNGKTQAAGLLRDQVAVVTGGGSGIGQATCLRLAREGARVVVVDLDPARAEETLKRLSEEGLPEALGIGANVAIEEDMAAMAQRAIDRFGRIDILVHCAGIIRAGKGNPRMVAEMETREWDDVIGTNLRGTFLANRAVIPAMIRQRGGNIVNISSTSGRQGFAFAAAYCASKFGVMGFSESLAEEVRTFGIKVQVVCPGAVDTPLWQQNASISAPGHALPPERVADLIAYLVTLPPDAILQNVVIMPFKARRWKKRGGESPGTSEEHGKAGEDK